MIFRKHICLAFIMSLLYGCDTTSSSLDKSNSVIENQEYKGLDSISDTSRRESIKNDTCFFYELVFNDIIILKSSYSGYGSELLVKRISDSVWLINEIVQNYRDADDSICTDKFVRLHKFNYKVYEGLIHGYIYTENDRQCRNSLDYFIKNFDSTAISGENLVRRFFGAEFSDLVECERMNHRYKPMTTGTNRQNRLR